MGGGKMRGQLGSGGEEVLGPHGEMKAEIHSTVEIDRAQQVVIKGL
jgi:hypothetical protein